MKALVITIPRDTWPASMANHWHIVDTHISRHVVTAMQSNYPNATVEEYEWKGKTHPLGCRECGAELRRR